METASYMHGEPSWQDQSSADAAQAAEFYAGLFGWDVDEPDEEHGGYRNAHLNGKRVAGITPQMGPGPAFWSTYIKVDDSAAVTELVSANGGRVFVEPMNIAPFGTMAVYLDPTGAAIGTWKPEEHTGAQVRGESGAATWHELLTTDVAAATAFYTAVFGWTAHSHGPADGPGGYTEFRVSDKVVAGMMARPPMMPAEVPDHWAVYFAVDDTDAVAAKVAELGGKVLTGPMDIPPGRFAAVADPTGASFNILKSSR